MDNQEKNITEPTEVSTETAKAPEAKKTEKKKSSGNGPVRIAILVVCLAVFAFSGYKIISEFMDGADTEDMYENLQEAARGDEDENAEDSKDDVNVPPAPNVSGSGGVVENETEDKTETPDSSETVENNENTETPDASGEASAENTENPDSSETTGSENAGTQTQPQTPSTDTVQNNDTYADRTYEEELAEQEQMKEDKEE